MSCSQPADASQPKADIGERAFLTPSKALSPALSVGAVCPGSIFFCVGEACGIDAPLPAALVPLALKFDATVNSALALELSAWKPGALGRVNIA
jgi:hypothetical protein